MPTKINRESYCRLIEEDLEWLKDQPETLERNHIEEILKSSDYFWYNNLDYRDAKRIKIEDGDIVVLTDTSSDNETRNKLAEGLNRISQIFIKQFKKRIQFFILKPDQDITLLDEKEMNKFGWFRKKDINPFNIDIK